MEKTHQNACIYPYESIVLFNKFLKEPKTTYCLERRALFISGTEEINWSDYNER